MSTRLSHCDRTCGWIFDGRCVDSSSHKQPVGSVAAAAQVCSTDRRDAICSRSSTEHAPTTTNASSSARRHAASVDASWVPEPSVPVATSRATTTCIADPGTARMRKVEISAASEP